MHSRRSGTFAVIVAGTVSASIFRLLGTDGVTVVAELGTYVVAPSGYALSLIHSEPALTNSALRWSNNPVLGRATTSLVGPGYATTTTPPTVSVAASAGDLTSALLSAGGTASGAAASIGVSVDDSLVEGVITFSPSTRMQLASRAPAPARMVLGMSSVARPGNYVVTLINTGVDAMAAFPGSLATDLFQLTANVRVDTTAVGGVFVCQVGWFLGGVFQGFLADRIIRSAVVVGEQITLSRTWVHFPAVAGDISYTSFMFMTGGGFTVVIPDTTYTAIQFAQR